MKRACCVALAALFITACGSSRNSSSGGGTGPGNPCGGNPCSAGENPETASYDESKVPEADKMVIDRAETMVQRSCTCTDKTCADRHVGMLFGFVIEMRSRKASKPAQKRIADLVAKQVSCAQSHSVDRAVVGRLLLIAATAANDWAEEVQKLRDASCDCKNASCSSTVLAAYAELVRRLRTIKVTRDEAQRAGRAGNTLVNCMKSLGLTADDVAAAMKHP
jgi:hypothetical protein